MTQTPAIELAYAYTPPERDSILYLRGLRFWIRIIPGRIAILFPIHDDAEVAGSSLPWAKGVARTVLEMLALERIGREIMIAFHNHGVVAFGHGCAIPCCLHCFSFGPSVT